MIQNKSITLAVAGTAISIAAATATAQTRQVIYAENFDGVALIDNVFEGLFQNPPRGTFPMAWSPTLPGGWTETFTVTEVFGPGLEGDFTQSGSTEIGVTEWRGWSLANEVFWVASDDQRRGEFRDGFADGAVLVADPDEWDDDLGIPGEPQGLGAEDDDFNNGVPQRFFDATATSPAFSIAGAQANSVEVNFFSSWRPEDTQAAAVEYRIDNGPWQILRRYESDPASPDFVGDEPNAAVSLPVNNPAGSQTMQLRFSMLDARNDWWFAVDDIFVSAVTNAAQTAAPGWFFVDVPTFNETLTPTLDFNAIGADSYVVEFARDAAFTDIVFSDETSTAGYAVPGGALQTGFYYVRVFAENEAGARQSLFAPRIAVDSTCAFDLNGDNQSTITDLLIFIANFRDGCAPVGPEPTVLYTETFEGLALMDTVSASEAAATGVWTNVAPTGWSVNNTANATGGVAEFRGWTFVNRDWWNTTAGQNRGQFTLASGTIAVADSDEMDDLPGGRPTNTLLLTPAINVAGQAAGSLSLAFDSSWRPEDSQTAQVLVSFDGGPFNAILTYNSSNTSDNGANINERVVLPLNNPAASTVRFRFDYTNGSNNWWWAIDDVQVLAN